MPRLKITRFKAPRPAGLLLDRYLVVYDLKTLYVQPESLPPISAPHLFGRAAPLVFDLGCGRGDFLIGLAAAHPAECFVGFDLHWKSLWDAIHKAHRAGLENIRFVRTDLRWAMKMVPDASVSEAYMLFPPPRVEPNRQQEDLLPEATLRDLHRVLRAGASFHFVTDHPGYFASKRALVESSGLFEIVATSQAFEGGQTWFQQFWESREIESRRFECRKLPG
jgi:tRNA (guanine-N7-)-methyltransferase